MCFLTNLLLLVLASAQSPVPADDSTLMVPAIPQGSTLASGGIIRMDSTEKVIYLVFTGHEFADGGDSIRGILQRRRIQASFFFTGDFYRTPRFRPLIEGLVADGNYLGGHSDRHLLYAPWSNRDSLLVTREQFMSDLSANYREMERFGITKSAAPWFLPPFEWYNAVVAGWCVEAGLRLVNFTPGTRSNADYTVPGEDASYVSSAEIIGSILRREEQRPSGLNGFILLMHIGTDQRRTDKLHGHLDSLLDELGRRGYQFRRLPAGDPE